MLLAGQTRVARRDHHRRLPQLARVGFEFSCYRRNNMWWGKKEAMRPLDQVEYAGVQLGGTGSVVYGGLVPGWYFEIENVAFVNFTGTDACGHANTAIANQAAGIIDTTNSFESFQGFATCYPAHFSKLRFVDTPVGYARLSMHDGAEWLGIGNVRGGPDRGHARCYVVDSDGTLTDRPARRGGHVLRASAPYWWEPASIVDDCRLYEANHDDDPDFGMHVRARERLLARGGVRRRRAARYTYSALPHEPRHGGNCTVPAGGDWAGANLWECSVDFLTLEMSVPYLEVSGSEVLWAPITWSTVHPRAIGTSNYDTDETISLLQSSFEIEDAQNSLDRWPQPNTVVPLFRGTFRVDSMGDITDIAERGDASSASPKRSRTARHSRPRAPCTRRSGRCS